MPQLNCAPSNEAEPPATVDESENDAKLEALKCRRSQRSRSKNAETETSNAPEEESVKKAVKRKQPAKKTSPAKSSKSRTPKKIPMEIQSHENLQTDIQRMDVKMEQLEQMIDEVTDEEDMEEGEIPNSIAAESLAAESRTYYSCKLCHKDFTSAFILCLHLQIHEKVASTATTEDDSSAIAEEKYQTETVKIENVLEADAIPKVEEVKQEPIEDEPVGLNKNFVESLKRNLSLAMARNNL